MSNVLNSVLFCTTVLFASCHSNKIGDFPISYGNLSSLTPNLRKYIEESANLCKPDSIHICDGSVAENKLMLDTMVKTNTIKRIRKYYNCWLATTNPADVARVEDKTFICSPNRSDVVPDHKPGVKCQLGNWISSTDYETAIQQRFPGCMKGRTLYVIPFSMGPVGSPYSKVGVELTDSPYVVASMRIMTRMGTPVLNEIHKKDEFVKALHSVGTPPSGKHEYPSWPCDPERTIILHKPDAQEIVSYGSGYGGNSLLGKKCFALRIGSTIAKREGWLAEHMLILGITNPQGEKIYIAAAFPSACGKTNLAMLEPTLLDYKVECVGDDIAWMRFDDEGNLRAINPESGFFGVAPGTSGKTNPYAMQTIFQNTLFTNVATTSDSGIYWEGFEDEQDDDATITDWRGRPWTKNCSTPAAHPNSRFCAPAVNCPNMDPEWQSPKGVPISAIIFGGRRPEGVPLVYESFDWQHGVFVGASMRSEATAAAEHKGKVIMHDPFAMRPFLGYNFGHYLQHWLSMKKRPNVKLPKIFHVNWFRKSKDGGFLWPGYGENIRVLDWIFQRVKGNKTIYRYSPIGYIPTENSINLTNCQDQDEPEAPKTIDVNLKELFHVNKTFWKNEAEAIDKYFQEQVGSDLPPQVLNELNSLKRRLELSEK